MSNDKKPDIRFKNYSDDWEQRKLGDNIVEYTEKTTENNQYPVLTSSRKGIFFQTDYYDGNQIASADNTGYNIVPYGYFTYRHMSDDEIFHFNINDIAENGIVSTLYPVFTTDENLDSRYLQYQLNYGREFARYAILQKQGGSRTYMYLNKLRNLYLTVPTAIEEQKKISEYFTNLDHLITLHQRKYDKLQNLKKAMLEKMFPKNGSNVPEIRFKGFTDDWEQRKLLDCIQKITDFRGRTPKKLGMDWSEEGYLALSAFNVKDGYIDFNQDVHYGNQELYDKWMAGNELHKGQVLFTTEAPMGNVAQVPDNRRYILSQRTIAFDVKDKLITENFLATVLRTPTVFADLTALSSGGTAKGVSQKSLASVEIRLPKDLNEQEKIADTFFNLDHLITLHQRKP